MYGGAGDDNLKTSTASRYQSECGRSRQSANVLRQWRRIFGAGRTLTAETFDRRRRMHRKRGGGDHLQGDSGNDILNGGR